MIASSDEEEMKCNVGETSSSCSSSTVDTGRGLASEESKSDGERRGVSLQLCSMGHFPNCVLYMTEGSQYGQRGVSGTCGCIHGGLCHDCGPDVDLCVVMMSKWNLSGRGWYDAALLIGGEGRCHLRGRKRGVLLSLAKRVEARGGHV